MITQDDIDSKLPYPSYVHVIDLPYSSYVHVIVTSDMVSSIYTDLPYPSYVHVIDLLYPSYVLHVIYPTPLMYTISNIVSNTLYTPHFHFSLTIEALKINFVRSRDPVSPILNTQNLPHVQAQPGVTHW